MKKEKKSSTKYLIMLVAIVVYLSVLSIPVFLRKVDVVWVLYGLLPSSFGIYTTITAYLETTHHERNANKYLELILTNSEETKLYVRTIAGIEDPKEGGQ